MWTGFHCKFDSSLFVSIMQIFSAHVNEILNAKELYDQLIDFAVKLAECGLIHCDFNEFNVLVTSEGNPVVIDFPQAVSTKHPNSELYFDRDVEAIARFFANRFNYISQLPLPDLSQIERKCDLDVSLKASGFKGLSESESEEEDVADDGDIVSAADEKSDVDEDSSSEVKCEEEEEDDEECICPEEKDSLAIMARRMDDFRFDEEFSLEGAHSRHGDSSLRGDIDYEKIRRIVKNDMARKMRKREIRSAKAECTRRNATKGVEKNLKKDAEAFFD
ncbi:hypothetical protein M513_01298 [Trichuris suis]|uniref:non-specific serine/threonine protein kinase n=1 Tax=Trichuris suis TaxID=68888 RepID=A0A085MK82_9BILA|nr:hypothetical protein M513_01298 [Trichuris suis]